MLYWAHALTSEVIGRFMDHLFVDEVLVNATKLDEFSVVAALKHFAMLHDNDFISILDRRESMSDDNSGLLAWFNELVKSSLHKSLWTSVESTGSLIKKKHFRLSD